MLGITAFTAGCPNSDVRTLTVFVVIHRIFYWLSEKGRKNNSHVCYNIYHTIGMHYIYW